MATAFAKAYVQIVPQADGFSDEAKKALGGVSGSTDPIGEKTGKSFGAKFKTAALLGIGAVATGFTALAKAGFDAGSELQQNLGGTEAVFGNFAFEIQRKAQDAYKNMGMSASEYMATANKMGALFEGSGMRQVDALFLTEKAMQRAADVASVMGLDTSAAMEAIAGAAKGNFTMMDNLGVAMNETTLQAYAMEQGMTKAQYAALAGADKSELAIKMFMERTSQYAGNFARESEETLSGSLGAMKAIAEDLIGNLALGKSIQPQLEALGETVKTFISNNLAPMLKDIAKALPDVIVALIDAAGDLVPDLIPIGLEIVGAIVMGIVNAVPALILEFAEIISKIGEKMLNADWKSIGHNIMDGIRNGISQRLASLAESVKNAAQSALNAMKRVLGIKSPSKKFAELGRYSIEGFVEGLDDKGLVSRTMRGISQIATESLGGYEITARASVPVSGNISAAAPAAGMSMQIDAQTNALLGALNILTRTVQGLNLEITMDGMSLASGLYGPLQKVGYNRGGNLAVGVAV